MYSEKLESLIAAALADGQVTPQERNVLLRKAQEEGIDIDEFTMVLDARIVEYQQKNSPAPKPSGKNGVMKKCPSCGFPVESMTMKCPECGYEFTGVSAVTSASKLFDLLQAAEMRKSDTLAKHRASQAQRLSDLQARQSADTGFFGKKARQERHESERDDLMDRFDEETDEIERKVEDEKRNIIVNFPVPNDKENLMEILAMATSGAYDNDGVIGPIEEVWIQKCDQIYQKIIVRSDNDREFLEKATGMIVALMKRLPKQYKKFTEIPLEMRSQIQNNLQKEKEMEKQRKMDIYKKEGKWGLPCLIVGLLFFFIGMAADMSVLSLIGIGGIVAAFFAYRRAKKELELTI